MVRIELRPVERSDIPALYLHQADPESNRMAAVKPRDEGAFAALWERIFGDGGVVARAILADGALAGHMCCFEADGRRCLGYWIAREHWGRGVATGAMRLFLAEVRERPLHARVARSNGASLRVLERCGFKVVGYEMSEESERFLACEEAVLRLE